jgi:enolase-phosphatase E1
MTVNLNDISAKCILLDIEGTTTPIDFVYKILFPYAREHFKEYLSRNWKDQEVQQDLTKLRDEQAADSRQGLDPPIINVESPANHLESAVAYLHWLMDHDRKSTPLKSLQGKIWEEGYRSGELQSQIFDDVPPAFERWNHERKLVCIYSSGSVLAQKLLFGYTTAGDLTKYIFKYFDTTSGSKVLSGSYLSIAEQLELSPAEIVFASDVVAELNAAHAAGFRTVCVVRPGNRPIEQPILHPTITTF